jgi:Family of unknown function (DUF5681)
MKTVALVRVAGSLRWPCSSSPLVPATLIAAAEQFIRLAESDQLSKDIVMKKPNSNSTKKTIVGYRRPPVEHQFKRGQSGNPGGRPKGVRNFTSDLLQELAGFVSIKDGDSSVQVTRQRAIVKAVVNAALEGDQRAATTVFGWSSRAFGSEPEPETDETESDPDDQAIAEASAERQRKRDGDPS